MKKSIIRKLSQALAFGCVAAIFNAITFGMAYLAVRLFCCIPNVGGYAAVLVFMLALLAAAVVLYGIYCCGAWIASMQDGKYSK